MVSEPASTKCALMTSSDQRILGISRDNRWRCSLPADGSLPDLCRLLIVKERWDFCPIGRTAGFVPRRRSPSAQHAGTAIVLNFIFIAFAPNHQSSPVCIKLNELGPGMRSPCCPNVYVSSDVGHAFHGRGTECFGCSQTRT